MKRIKYMIERIVKLDYKNMFKISKSISKKANKNYFFTLFDIIYCGLKYGAGYYDYQEFEFYNLNKKERETYLTRRKNNEIVSKYNDKNSFYKFEDKIKFNEIFAKYLKREYLYLEDKSFNDFLKFFKKHKDIIVKPIDASGGEGIEKFSFINEKDAKKVYDNLIKNKQLLIEEVIVQNEKMNTLYDKSVNTLRMFTFYKDGKSYFLQAVLKIGNGGVIDNFSNGGMYTFVDDKGKVFAPAIDREDNIYKVHPLSKKEIIGFEVPEFQEAVKLVEECAKVVPEIGYVGWDVAISKNGPVIVEGNCFPGVYQVKPSFVTKKEGLLAKYKKIMK